MFGVSGRPLAIGFLLAIAVGVGATIATGQVCTYGDDDGCEDRTKQERRDIMRFDGDWYGWPVPWRTDMSAEGIVFNEWDESGLMVSRQGVSAVLFSVSVAVWTTVALATEAVLFLSIRHRVKNARRGIPEGQAST